MDSRYTGEMLKHLEKQKELLTESRNSMTHELHKLQVTGAEFRWMYFSNVFFLMKSLLSIEGRRRNVDAQVLRDYGGSRTGWKDSSNGSDSGEDGNNTALVAKTSKEHLEDSRNGQE